MYMTMLPAPFAVQSTQPETDGWEWGETECVLNLLVNLKKNHNNLSVFRILQYMNDR